jgi:predicted AlkP superfamily pyrophosphatase or phosphodiesterase
MSVIVINVAGLAPRHFEKPELIPNLAKLRHCPMRPTFPAVTCSMQATLLSGKPPSEHGIIANGYFDRDTFEVKFWEQPAALVQAPRLWDMLPGRKTAVLFWQNSMFINADIVVTPRPLHFDSGMVQWCYSKPVGFYEELGDFKLQKYWGPVAGLESSQWIAHAAQHTWRKHRPDLMLVYLPHLDYSSQKFGPDQPQALREVDSLVGELMQDANVIVCSEYSLTPVAGALFPNRLLRAAGLLRVRKIAGKEYLDFELSDAFAMVDHQIAHIYCKPGYAAAARSTLQRSTDVTFASIAHPRAGELIAVAPRDKWFAYYWWDDWAKAPEFAFTVDIHRKPGYDPCELWFDYGRMARTFKIATGTDPSRVKASHGRVDDDPRDWAVCAGMMDLPEKMSATDFAPLVCKSLLS